MIAVILLYESRNRPFTCRLPCLGEVIYIVGHGCKHLLLRYATYSGIVGAHGYILQVVQLAENAELREFCDAREEHELQIRITVFEWRIEIAHDIA